MDKQIIFYLPTAQQEKNYWNNMNESQKFAELKSVRYMSTYYIIPFT